jgi:hypothetical protein
VARVRLAHNPEVIPQEQTAVAATLSSSQLCYKGKACDVTVPEIERPQRGRLNSAPFSLGFSALVHVPISCGSSKGLRAKNELINNTCYDFSKIFKSDNNYYLLSQ